MNFWENDPVAGAGAPAAPFPGGANFWENDPVVGFTPNEEPAPPAGRLQPSSGLPPTSPPTEAPTTPPSEPGFVSTALEAAQRGLLEAGGQLGATASAVARGTLEAEQPIDYSRVANDRIGKLLEQKIDKGWSNPNWWAAHIAHGIAASSPLLAGSLAGAAAGSMALPGLGTVAGLGVGAALGGAAGGIVSTVAQSFVPEFQKNRALGMSPDEAFNQAWKTTGVEAAAGGFMGGTAGMQFIKAPIKNAIFQMFGLQPAAMVGAHAGVATIEGQDVTPTDLATTYAVGAGVGGVMAGAHAGLRRMLPARTPGGEEEKPPSMPPPKEEPGVQSPVDLFGVPESELPVKPEPTPAGYGPAGPRGDYGIAENAWPPGLRPLPRPEEPRALRFRDEVPGVYEAPQGPQEPLFQEIATKPGADIGRLAKLLGAKLYGTPQNLPGVAVKEMVQNAFDAIKSLPREKIKDGKIDIYLRKNEREIEVRDNGVGMKPEVLGKQFLQIAGTLKETSQASGGLGIAKMLFLYENERINVITMRDGKVAQLLTSGPELKGSLTEGAVAPRLNVHELKDLPQMERVHIMGLFPEGHGTAITIKVPESYVDPSTGDTRFISFPERHQNFPVLKNSPLFHPIAVKFNGDRLPIGSQFPSQDFTQFANVNFDWGTARIYVTKERVESVKNGYMENNSILSNGLWQFDSSIKKDPLGGFGGENIARRFYIDVSPRVQADEAGYPFDLNRQRLTDSAQRDFNKILNYVSLLYRGLDYQEKATNFGNIQYIERGVDGPALSKPEVLAPSKKGGSPASLVSAGDRVEVVEGKLIVNGREIPELTRKDLEAARGSTEDVSIPQESIDPNRVMLHNNVEIMDEAGNYIPLLDWARSKYGSRVDGFMLDVGEVLKDLRDKVVEVMEDPDAKGLLPLSYKGLLSDAVGISFDEQYRGVSIRGLPFNGTFINIARPEYTDAQRSAVGTYMTMIHELAHHQVRNHDADFVAELQRLMTNTEHLREGMLDRLYRTFSKNNDILEGMTNVLDTGSPRPIGDRFESGGEYAARDGGGDRGAPVPGERPRGLGQLLGRPGGGNEAAFSKRKPGRLSEPPQSSLRTEADKQRVRAAKDMAADGSPNFPVEPHTPEAIVPRHLLDKLALGGDPDARSMAAGADRFNRVYHWMLSMVQVAARNSHIEPLQRYAELWFLKQNLRASLMDRAETTLKSWRALGRQMGDNVTALLDDYLNMRYLSKVEWNLGEARMPTREEFGKMLETHKVNDEGRKVFLQIAKDFQYMLRLYKDLLTEQAEKITDPERKAARLADIEEQYKSVSSRPYFPVMRFGDFTVTVRNTPMEGRRLGTVSYYAHFKTAREAKAEAARQEAAKKEGQTVSLGKIDKEARPFVGMPPSILDVMQEKLNLSQDQRRALEQIRMESQPSSFRSRFPTRHRTPGYSMDFMRAYANYFFHGSNHYTRVKYIDSLREQVKEVRAQSKELVDGRKRADIANFMDDHLSYMMNPAGDWASLRSVMFTWALGFSPAAAFINLTQLPLNTYPFLASKFGDARAVAKLIKVGKSHQTYWKKARFVDQSEPVSRAMDEAVKQGTISESQASTMAAAAEGRSLSKGFGGTASERLFNRFAEYSSWMFEMAEQTNRRITFRTAFELALENPNSKHVQEMTRKHALQYEIMRKKNWTPEEAAAFVTAKDATETTQYIYQQWAQPRFMRGKARTVFIFKSFLQNSLFFLWNYPGAMTRSMLMMGFLGGMMGIPGSEDAKGMIKAIGWQLFGKDWDVEKEARKFVIDVLKERIPADTVLHGLSRDGFGIPSVMSMLGAPVPGFDMSRSIGIGQISPIDIGEVLGPGGAADPSKIIAQQAQRASGAALGVGFNIYKSLTSAQYDWNDSKRWQSSMPRALQGLTRAYRAYKYGMEKDARGDPVVRFDVNDPKGMAEVLMMTGGFIPTRLGAKWEQIGATADAVEFWNLRRQILLRQAWQARRVNDVEGWNRVISAVRKFNRELPPEAKLKAITAETLRGSLRSRARASILKQAGSAVQRSDIPIVREIQRLYPEAEVDVRETR